MLEERQDISVAAVGNFERQFAFHHNATSRSLDGTELASVMELAAVPGTAVQMTHLHRAFYASLSKRKTYHSTGPPTQLRYGKDFCVSS